MVVNVVNYLELMQLATHLKFRKAASPQRLTARITSYYLR